MLNAEVLVNVIFFIVFPLATFIVFYTYYNIYKIVKGKCKVCGRELDNKLRKVIKIGWLPWKKPKFICQECKTGVKMSLP